MNILDKLRNTSHKTIVSAALFAVGIVVGILVAKLMFLNSMKLKTPADAGAPIVTDTNPSTSSTNAGSTASTTTVLDIAWHPAKKLTLEQAFRTAVRTAAPDEATDERIWYNVTSTSSSDYAAGGVWDLGTVQGGPYDGARYLYWKTVWCDPGGCTDYRLLVSADGKQAWGLQANDDQYRNPQSSGFSSFVTMLQNVDIPSLAPPPSTLTLANGRTVTMNEPGFFWGTSIQYEDSLNGTIEGLHKLSQTKESVDLYSTDNGAGCVFVFAKDGTTYTYHSVIPTEVRPDLTQGAMKVTWTDDFDYSAKTDYTPYIVGGCGIGICPQTVSDADVGSLNDLHQVGTTTEGDPVYAPKHPEKNSIVKSVYDTWMPLGSDGQYVTTKPSMAAFFKSDPAPVLFWRDGFGRWIRYLRTDATPPGECGKPVIYLYPPKTEAVSVALPKFITLTKSEPTYPTNGWNVIAHPDGSLSYGDGKTYGSLYWEGTGVGYQTPKDGFIIKDGEVDHRLTQILAQYGLNETESREFRDFWVPKMTGAPYYRVSFLTSEWSKAAPLFITPRPQTAIRIFMDWQKLAAPIDLPEPVISTPVRNGFTLVEWGGLLR